MNMKALVQVGQIIVITCVATTAIMVFSLLVTGDVRLAGRVILIICIALAAYVTYPVIVTIGIQHGHKNLSYRERLHFVVYQTTSAQILNTPTYTKSLLRAIFNVQN